jgi:hypothetical protein
MGCWWNGHLPCIPTIHAAVVIAFWAPTVNTAGCKSDSPMAVMPSPKKILTSCVDNPRPLGCPQMNWGRTLKKRPFRVMTFQPSSSDGARWRLIETNGVLFALLKRRVIQKRHRPPPDKTSGLSFDTAMYPHEYKNLHGNSRWANKMNRKKEKKKYKQSD